VFLETAFLSISTISAEPGSFADVVCVSQEKEKKRSTQLIILIVVEMSRSKLYPTLKEYLKHNTPETLKQESSRLRARDERIPVLVFVASNSTNADLSLKNQKFLISPKCTAMQLKYEVRQHVLSARGGEAGALKSDEALYYFVDSTLLDSSALLAQVYKQYAHPCGFLFIEIAKESTFGC
jgi:hypothetical protein